MTPCVYIDLGDGDWIKPNFSKDPTPQMIADAKPWGLAQKAETKALEARGGCLTCRGKGTIKRRDYDNPGFKLADFPCEKCHGTGTAGEEKP